ncbi:MAG: hypothetical protein ACXVCP_03205 [Bdellovibrio sp.]
MPEIKHYDKKKHQAKKHQSNKRRPHHETEEVMTEADESTLEASDAVQGEFEGIADESQRSAYAENDAINTEAQNEGARASAEHMDTETGSETEHNKVHLNFYGSELIRQKAPKVMDLADTVADEWVHDGKFEGLPLGNPLAQMAAAKALRTAKDVEKKLEEKGVFTMAKIGVDYLKSKIEKKK